MTDYSHERVTHQTIVRELMQDDVAEAAPILRAAWIGYANNSDIADKKFFHTSDSEAWLSGFLEKGGLGFVAERDTKLGGVVTFQVEDSPVYWVTGKHILIMDIAIDKAYQRQGIAMQLERHIEQYAQENGIGLVLGEVWEYNEASKNMMKKLGRTPLYTVWGKQFDEHREP